MLERASTEVKALDFLIAKECGMAVGTVRPRVYLLWMRWETGRLATCVAFVFEVLWSRWTSFEPRCHEVMEVRNAGAKTEGPADNDT